MDTVFVSQRERNTKRLCLETPQTVARSTLLIAWYTAWHTIKGQVHFQHNLVSIKTDKLEEPIEQRYELLMT